MNQRNIAKLAGVSSATVSRVINNDPNVSEKKANRVKEVIQKHGYVPNAMARNLRMSNTKTIGYLVPDIRNPFFPQMLGGIEAACWEKGYDIIFENTDEKVEKEQDAINTLLRYRVDGIIADFVAAEGAHIDRVTNMGIPIVLIDRKRSAEEKNEYVIVDNAGGIRQLVEYLAELGHRKIALISGPEVNTPGIERMKGFHSAMKKVGIDINEDYIVNGMFTEDGGYECACKLMDMKKPPSAIITANNLMTMGAFKALADKAIQIPKDVSLAGFDDFPMAAYLSPPLTVVDRPTWEMGKIAAEVLLQRIEKSDTNISHKELILPTKLLIRGSCAPAS